MLNIFTIVLNGQPYIRRHLRTFDKLDFPWKWSVVHGIADPIDCTNWCHYLDRVESDGSLPYLTAEAAARPGQMVLQSRERWPGKAAMVNAALAGFDSPGILLEVDADEIWTAQQLAILVRLFEAYPACDAAYFFCRFFVGPRRVITQPGAYGNNPAFEWLRAWRWAPGRRFQTHEPPVLEGQSHALSHGLTAAAGLVFQHFAYATEAAVAFKERYYGYRGALDGWRRLNAQPGPADAKDFLPWIKSPAMTYPIR